MPSSRLRLTNDDEPTSLAPRSMEIVREGFVVGENPAVLASVEPPLEFGALVPAVLLISRTRGVSIDEMVDRAAGRVYVCQYVGDSDPIPDRLSRDDLKILFWGLIGSDET
jgi:hypothetical protein